MLFCRKHLALLAAVMLLCGCTNNGGSSVTETESTAETVSEISSTAEATGEISAPEQGGASQEAAPGDPGVSGGDGEAAQNPGGVDLISGGYSENSLIFDLKGTYCDVSELPFSIKTYSLPPETANLYFRRFGGGRLYFTDDVNAGGDGGTEDEFSGMPAKDQGGGGAENVTGEASSFTLYAFDLETGDLTEEYSGEGRYVYADDKYVVTRRSCIPGYIYDDGYFVPEDGVSGVTSVIRLSNGNTVYEYNNDDGYFSTLSGEVVIVYDTMYYDALYKLPDFDKSIPVTMTVNLLTGERSLYDINVGAPSTGAGGVVFEQFDDDGQSEGRVNIKGDSYLPDYSSMNTEWYLEGHFPIRIDTSFDSVLGSRNELNWINNANEPIGIGTTGFRIVPVSMQISRDGLFVVDLVKFEDAAGDPFTGSRRAGSWRVIGCYDGRTSQNTAAITECNWSDEYLFTDQGKIYILNIPKLEIKVLKEYWN